MKELNGIFILFLLGASIILTTIGCKPSDIDKHNYSDTTDANEKKSLNDHTTGKAVDSVEKLEIGGIEQWIYLKGEDSLKPVLLFLHGGPGYVMMPLLNMYNSELEKHFVVVNWDQRGAGLSYSRKVPPKSMTLKQFVSDVHEMTSYLKTRFYKEKIYIAGHSFGTILGMKAISEFPEDYWAYMGIGQVVDIGENEQLCYDFALKSAKEDNNQKAVKQLTAVGRPNIEGKYKNDSGYEITVKWMEYYGGDLYGKSTTRGLEDEIYESEIYKNAGDKIEKGLSFSALLFEDKEVMKIDFRKQIKKVNVPVYFFSGRHDYDTPFKLVEQYYNILNAPEKALIWFDNSAHFPFYEEPEIFNTVIIDDILPETLNPNEITGNWEGTYTINQGISSVKLKVTRMEDGSYVSIFSFEASEHNSDINKGVYGMDVDFSATGGHVSFKGTEWIEKPAFHEMVNLVGTVSGKSITGNIVLQDNITKIGTFTLEKSN